MSLRRHETDGFLGMPQARGTGWGDPEWDGAGADQEDGNGCVKGKLGGRQTSPALCFELQVCSGFSVHLGKSWQVTVFRRLPGLPVVSRGSSSSLLRTGRFVTLAPINMQMSFP